MNSIWRWSIMLEKYNNYKLNWMKVDNKTVWTVEKGKKIRMNCKLCDNNWYKFSNNFHRINKTTISKTIDFDNKTCMIMNKKRAF